MEQLEPRGVTRKDGVYTVRTKQRMDYSGQEIMMHPGAAGVTTTTTTVQGLEGWSAYLDPFQPTV